MRIVKNFIALCIATLSSSMALAAHDVIVVPPYAYANQEGKPQTVNEILSKGFESQIITIIGNIKWYENESVYKLSDSNGDLINLQISDQCYKFGECLLDDENIRLEVVAKIKKDEFNTTLDVKRTNAYE